MSRLRMWPDPILSQKAEPVEAFDAELAELIAELLDALYKNDGRGLAAPKIGVLKRVFVVDANWKDGVKAPRAFVNPQVLTVSKRLLCCEERCLSLPDRPRRIARPETVELGWRDCEGELQRATFSGFAARTIQHDIDHLDGITVLDHPEAP